MAIQQIPLDGGLVTQADAEDVGINACTELINLEFDKPGILYKRGGLGVPLTISANINEITRWISTVDGVETVYWILCDTAGNFYVTTNLASLGAVVEASGSSRVRISNYGSMIRFANGLTHHPHIYQYINRGFFWDGYSPTAGFHSDDSKPRDRGYTLVSSGRDGTSSYVTSGLDMMNSAYQYKLTFVYDGNQESPISELGSLYSKAPIVGGMPTHADDVFYFQLKFLHSDWNPRVTAINVYRSKDAGAFYKVATASTLNAEKDLNVKKVTNAYVTRVMVDSQNGLTSAINGKVLYIEGFKHTIGEQINEQFASMSTSLNAYLSNQWNTLLGYDNLKFDNNDGGSHMTATGNQYVGGWWIGENGYDNLEGSTVGWTTYGSITVTTSTSEKKYGTGSLCFSQTVSGTANHYAILELGAYATATDVYVCSFWFKLANCIGNDDQVQFGISAVSSFPLSSPSSPDLKAVDYFAETGGTDVAGTSEKWRYIQFEFKPEDVGSYHPVSKNILQLHAYLKNCENDGKLYVDQLVVAKKVYNTTTGKLSIGSDVVASTDFDLGSEDSAVGWHSQVSSTGSGGIDQGGLQAIKKNLQFAYQNSGDGLAVSAGTETVHLCPQYAWRSNSGGHSFFLYRDTGDINGTVHPTGETSLDVNFTYAVNLEGRQYVAGVALNPSAENEIHDDWVMFSELNQPDVIPITNYISIPDMQGGEIKGLAKLLGDLVVLQSKGIYRISIPSASPSSWSLSESEANIGCVAPDSIVEHEAGIFFAGKDNMFYLGSNFEAIPITTSIKDVYQATANLENTRAIVDVKKNRLLCKFGNSNTTIYALDITKKAQGVEHWSKIDNSGSKNADLFTIDENLKVYAIESGTSSYLVEIDPNTASESVGFSRKTGWISIGGLDRAGVLRRFNIRYHSQDSITAKFYIDGDTSTVVKTITIPPDTAGADWYKCKPNIRCRYFMIELTQTAVADSPVEIRRMEVEVE